MNNVVIGVGGAGSKVLEAFVYTMSAGIGPQSEVKIGIVDQDQTNGSVSATEKTIADYYALRSQLRADGGDHLGLSNLFSGVTAYEPMKHKWSPAIQNDENLGKLLGYPTEADANLRDLFSALFEPSPNEIALPLNEGFRGRPFLGAAVITYRARQALAAKESLWGELSRMLRDQMQADMHCILVGSIFGGTGASGIPAIAKQLRDLAADRPDRLRITAFLMLPYFSYVDEITGRVAARSAESLSRAGNALRYYAEIIDEDTAPLFDQAYMIGWDPPIELKFSQDGGPKQKNPPMISELVAALGIGQMMAANGDADRRTGFSLLGRADSKCFGWTDIPEIVLEDQTRERLQQFVRFCLAYRYFYNQAMQGDPHGDLWAERAKRELGLDFGAASTRATLDALGSYCERFLQWFVAAQWADPVKRGPEDPRGIDLVRADTFATPLTADNPSLEDAQLRAKLRNADSEAVRTSLAAVFPRLFKFEEADALGPTLSEVFYRFSCGPWPKRSRGLGALVGSLYQACANSRN
jgi:hypothetical protein